MRQSDDTERRSVRYHPYFFVLAPVVVGAVLVGAWVARSSLTVAVLLWLVAAFFGRQLWETRPKRLPPEVLYEGITKAIIHDGPVERGWRWISSRRSVLCVTTTELRCGDWTIPFSTIDSATLRTWRSWVGLPGAALVVRAGGKTYQFGLMGSRFWDGELPFPVTREAGPVGYSNFSVVLRIAALGYLAWWLARSFGG